MIYREQPGQSVSGEAAPGEQAPTDTDWPGFTCQRALTLKCRLASTGRLGESRAGMGMIRQEGERVIPREHQIAASEAGLDLDRGAGGSEGICW